ncbi:thiamine phosphate synthase [Acidihalobacter ferrooxydans]|uniref:Thiamine-phosphate synthase n=1 Tax=Acidihalobacter ferrooxydans TaxID=1765967 RepID=A0A1P8UEB3_9GAMM|nr:thiamine phosphate synthase [Acidihalobacter ferrooxydans]APZ42187.1 thiamine-phosphate diphosphorylase [Acidihalobacter ferrooxydans]
MSRPALRGLYAITDARLSPGDRLLDAVDAALRGGARWIQYRDKGTDAARRLAEARALVELCHAHGAGLIVNDDVELAAACGGDGVHIGAEDASLAQARARLGTDAVIGVSCYNRLELAMTAAAKGADYVAFGSVFSSPTKPHAVRADLALLRAARERLSLPICAIGGIDAGTAATVAATGVDLLAVISAVFAATDVAGAAAEIVEAIAQTIARTGAGQSPPVL